jgi:hypothetical protein
MGFKIVPNALERTIAWPIAAEGSPRIEEI